MAYTDFSLARLNEQFGVRNQRRRLFETVEPVAPSAWLLEELRQAEELPVRSEKAKSEYIVVPMLKELRKLNDKYFTVHSGETLNADSALGLNGECDFMLAKDINSFDLNYPIVHIVEAKRNDLEIGVPQCAAQLVGARLFNENRGVKLEKIYGCVTTGNDWLFLTLENDLSIDTKIYYLNEVDVLLGIFQQIINYYRAII
jgi:hypothetical protein